MSLDPLCFKPLDYNDRDWHGLRPVKRARRIVARNGIGWTLTHVCPKHYLMPHHKGSFWVWELRCPEGHLHGVAQSYVGAVDEFARAYFGHECYHASG